MLHNMTLRHPHNFYFGGYDNLSLFQTPRHPLQTELDKPRQPKLDTDASLNTSSYLCKKINFL